MNRLLAELVNQNTPKYNPYIVNGLACYYVPKAMEWLDGIFRSASKSFPKGLTYDGCERCTPQEEYLEATRVRSTKRIFDLADSDLYLIKLKFSYEDEYGRKEEIENRYLYLPFVNEAGIFRISGNMYHMTGILSDKVISPGTNDIFVRLIRHRLKFYHTAHSVMVGDRRETLNVVWSKIYRKNKSDRSAPPSTNAHDSMVHYLLAKYGFTETFRKYVGFVPQVGRYQPGMIFPSNIIVCRSSYYGSNSRPVTYIYRSQQSGYDPSDLYIEIPKEKWNNATAAFVAGFFYVVDHFPDRVRIERLDDTFLWSVLLGHVIFSGLRSESKLYEGVTDHFGSLDDYLDDLIKDKLKEIGWNLENFYDLIAKITIEFPNLLMSGQMNANSMLNKSIEIIYYMLYENVSKIFKFIYYLKKHKTKKPLTVKMIKEAFNKNMRARTIYRINSNKMLVEAVSYCGDHKFPKLTSKITEQEAGSLKFNNSRQERVQITENNHIHASMVVCGNVLFMSKSNPMPNSRISPYIGIDLETGTLVPKPEHVAIINKLQDMLTHVNMDTSAYDIEADVDVDPNEFVSEEIDASKDEEDEDEDDSDPDLESGGIDDIE